MRGCRVYLHVAHVRVVKKTPTSYFGHLSMLQCCYDSSYDWNFLPFGERRQTDRQKEIAFSTMWGSLGLVSTRVGPGWLWFIVFHLIALSNGDSNGTCS